MQHSNVQDWVSPFTYSNVGAQAPTNLHMNTSPFLSDTCIIYAVWHWRQQDFPGYWQISGEWRKLRNEELNDLYSLPNIVRVVKSRRMRWAGHVACMGEDRGVHRMLVGKPEGKRPLGRPRRRWEDNIKIDLQEVWGGRGDWMELAQDRDGWRSLVGTVRNFRVP